MLGAARRVTGQEIDKWDGNRDAHVGISAACHVRLLSKWTELAAEQETRIEAMESKYLYFVYLMNKFDYFTFFRNLLSSPNRIRPL